MMEEFQAGRSMVTFTLQNKVRVTGRIKAFDGYIIIVENSKQEFVYRHAVSCVASAPPQEQRHRHPSASQAPETIEPTRVAKPSLPKPRPSNPKPRPSHPQPQPQPQLQPASSDNPSLNNSMKDGLLKWMQEHKAAK